LANTTFAVYTALCYNAITFNSILQRSGDVGVNARSRLALWFLVLLSISAMVATACSLGAPAPTPTPLASPTSSQKPSVTIQSPANNSDAIVGSQVTVQATGIHPDGVTRIELLANLQQVDSKVSQNPTGDQQLQTYLNYTPTAAGTLVLQVIAYHDNLASDPASITLNVKSTAATATNDTVSDGGSTDTDPTCRARVDVNGLNFRQGPGQNYPPLQVLSLGTIVPITGAIPNLTWWQGKVGNTTGWMSASYITRFGSLCTSVPAVQPPPSPVPTITPTPSLAPPIATATGSLPDLVVININGPASMVLDQNNTKTATYKVTVMNVGLANAGQFNVGMIMPDGTLRDMGLVASLAPGQQALFQTDITFNAPGTVRLTAFVDSNNKVVESSENDNLLPMDVVLIKPTPVPTTAVPTTAAPTATASATSAATSAATP
jgi:hypothetical protein